MVKFVVSPEIRQLISEYNTVRNLSEDKDGGLRPDSPSIEHLQLVTLASTVRAAAHPTKAPQYSLHNILKTTQLYIEPIEKPKPVSSQYFYADHRIPNIKPEWKLYDAVSNNKNTMPWSPTSNLNQKPTQYSPQTNHIPPRMPK